MIAYRKAKVEDKPALFSFYEKAYSENYNFRIDPFWTWQNISNPLIDDQNEGYVYIAIDSQTDIVVGQYILVPQDFIIDSKQERVFWGMFFYVLKEYRGKGIGKQLQQLTIEKDQLYLAVSVAWSTRVLILKLGGIELPPAYTLTHIINTKGEIARKNLIKHLRVSKYTKPLAKMLSLKNPVSRFHQSLLLKMYQTKVKIGIGKKSENFNDIIETQIDNPKFINIRALLSDSFDVFTIDSDESLKWRFQNHPNKNYKIFISKSDEWKGFMILREGISPEDNVGIISEIFATNWSGYDKLMRYSIKHFKNSGCETINILAPSHSDFRKYKGLGFIKTNKRTPVALARSQEKLEKLKAINNWYFTFESQDMDFFPNTRM